MIYILLLILITVEAWHDTHRHKYIIVAADFEKQRQSKLIKALGILIGLIILCFYIGFWYAAFYLVVRFLLFDVLYWLFYEGKIYSPLWYWQHSEIYYQFFK